MFKNILNFLKRFAPLHPRGLKHRIYGSFVGVQTLAPLCTPLHPKKYILNKNLFLKAFIC